MEVGVGVVEEELKGRVAEEGVADSQDAARLCTTSHLMLATSQVLERHQSSKSSASARSATRTSHSMHHCSMNHPCLHHDGALLPRAAGPFGTCLLVTDLPRPAMVSLCAEGSPHSDNWLVVTIGPMGSTLAPWIICASKLRHGKLAGAAMRTGEA